MEFQCSSASRKFLNAGARCDVLVRLLVSVLFSEPKIPQSCRSMSCPAKTNVSVLFSEPKIPQSAIFGIRALPCTCFSALQRAENSSISDSSYEIFVTGAGFSALQRAENSSIQSFRASPRRRRDVSVLFSEPKIPQCNEVTHTTSTPSCFSALQRAENSSIPLRRQTNRRHSEFQCSSASRKFLNARFWSVPQPRVGVSVLFSEPKIPQ